MDGKKLGQEEMLRFILAGESTFTIRNTETGNRFTYRVRDIHRADSTATRDLWWVKVLTGADNDNAYRFIGSIFPTEGPFIYKHSSKAKVAETAPSVVAFKWFLRMLQTTALPENVEMFHMGRCGRCGKTLTVPESIEAGYGPECVQLVGIETNILRRRAGV